MQKVDFFWKKNIDDIFLYALDRCVNYSSVKNYFFILV